MENSAGRPGGEPGGERSYFSGANCTLSAIDYGNRGKPDLVLVHGMRDHALALASVTQGLVDSYHVVVPDLRGHGDSENPGSYTMVQFVADLRALVLHFGLRDMILVGHSLGGHITSRYAALYPEEVRGLALIDGMGPPRLAEEGHEASQLSRWRSHIDAALQLSSDRRPMASADEALSRLTRNNPLLDHDIARFIVDHGVEPHPGGGVRWKWDPAVSMVWGTFDHLDSERQWPLIECPVLILTGDDAMSYWSRNNIADAVSRASHDQETERRRRLFRRARHEVIDGAGHMIHYDQPGPLNDALQRFLQSLNV